MTIAAVLASIAAKYLCLILSSQTAADGHPGVQNPEGRHTPPLDDYFFRRMISLALSSASRSSAAASLRASAMPADTSKRPDTWSDASAGSARRIGFAS